MNEDLYEELNEEKRETDDGIHEPAQNNNQKPARKSNSSNTNRLTLLKSSIAVKFMCALLSLVFFLGTLYFGAQILFFADRFGDITVTEYEQTSRFRGTIWDDIWDIALYVNYLEHGYVPDPDSFYNDMSIAFADLPRANLKSDTSEQSPISDYMTQASFDYLNRKINLEYPVIFYFVQNIDTGKYYYPSNVNDSILQELNFPKKLSDISADTLTVHFRNTSKLHHFWISYNFVSYPLSDNLVYIENSKEVIQWLLGGSGSLYDDQSYYYDGDLQYEVDPGYNSDPLHEVELDYESSPRYEVDLDYGPSSDSAVSYPEYNFAVQYIPSAASAPNSTYAMISDDFAQYRSLCDVGIVGAPLMLLGFLLALVGMCICAGHTRKYGAPDAPAAYAYDKRIPGEANLLLLLVPIIVVAVLFDSYHYYFPIFFADLALYPGASSRFAGYLVAGIICAVFFACQSAVLMSFIRLIKTRSLLNSFLVWRLLRYLLRYAKRFMRFAHRASRAVFSNTGENIRRSFSHVKYSSIAIIAIVFIFIIYETICIIAAGYCLNYYSENGLTLIAVLMFLIGFAAFAALVLRFCADIDRLREATLASLGGDYTAHVKISKMSWIFKGIGENLNHIDDGLSAAVTEKMKSERMKSELITNVSHDIKTPLTSLITYIDLLKKVDLKNEVAIEYITVLDEKSLRLKTLIEDLTEASKASSGAIALDIQAIRVHELVSQIYGDFADRFEAARLEAIIDCTEAHSIFADGRCAHRIIDNLFSNAVKYAMPGTRVYVSSSFDDTAHMVSLTVKNTSKDRLSLSPDELTERFVRGDASRRTEGSGLGLSIAKSLCELMHGRFEILIDADLFTVRVTLPAEF